MEHTITLTDEQELGIVEEATHNIRTVEEYLQWRIDQYAELGNKRLIRMNTEVVVNKLYLEPTIVNDISIVVDEKIAVVVASRETEKIEEIIKEPIVEEKL
jgi:hypothetical protein